jgi:hypothetical protein
LLSLERTVPLCWAGEKSTFLILENILDEILSDFCSLDLSPSVSPPALAKGSTFQQARPRSPHIARAYIAMERVTFAQDHDLTMQGRRKKCVPHPRKYLGRKIVRLLLVFIFPLLLFPLAIYTSNRHPVYPAELDKSFSSHCQTSTQVPVCTTRR